MTAAADLILGLGDLQQGVETVERHRDASTLLETLDQAAAIALVQDLRRRLGQVEMDLTTTLGKAEGQFQGNLPDGRQFTLKRTAERKGWDHEDWKRDARRKVVQTTSERYAVMGYDDDEPVVVYNTETGETASLAAILHEAVTMAQEVHGSTAPRSTALKRLGLYASDYCESSPGGWKFDAIKPHETTTEKDNTDA